MSRRRPTVTKHLPCPTCEYDLFGLVGDQRLEFGLLQDVSSVRCPECGEEVDPDWALKQLRAKKVKASFLWLVLCAAAFIPLGGGIGLCIVRPGFSSLGVLIMSAILWVACLGTYARRHRGVDYAGRVLLMFHGCFVLAATGVFLICYAVFYIAPRTPWFSSSIWARGRWLDLIVGAAFLFWPAWWLYWRACGLIEDGHGLLLHRILKRPQ